MVHIPRPPCFPAAQTLQDAFGALGVLGLEFGTKLALLPALPVQVASGEAVSGGGGGDLHDPQIHPHEPHRFRVLHPFGHLAGGGQVPLPALAEQVALTLAVLGQEFELFGEVVKSRFFIRTDTVQIDTVRASICQDRHRSSKGWAASRRKEMGVEVAR